MACIWHTSIPKLSRLFFHCVFKKLTRDCPRCSWWQYFCVGIENSYLKINKYSCYKLFATFNITLALAHLLHPIKSRSRNKHRHLWVGLCASSRRPWFWPVYSLYHIHAIHYSSNLSKWNELFLWDIHIKSWCGPAGVLNDLILLLFPVWFQVYISIVQYYLFHNMDKGAI